MYKGWVDFEKSEVEVGCLDGLERRLEVSGSGEYRGMMMMIRCKKANH